MQGTTHPHRRQLIIIEIQQERGRQVLEEGFDEKRDDLYCAGELGYAAACYAERAGKWFKHFSPTPPKAGMPAEAYQNPATTPEIWPWPASWWKPKSPRRDLIRAAALIVAEIERIDRAVAAEKKEAAHDRG